jgi:hypothetical protein
VPLIATGKQVKPMQDKIEVILEKIRGLEHELIQEIQKKEEEFYYEIRRTKVIFAKEVRKQHRLLVKTIRYYLKEAAFLNILTAPIIWALLIPAILMDLSISIYQAICFPVYGIPKVRRQEYIILDRRYLSYLNIIEKFNCVYCGYFNGVIAYVQEISARTEQYWCPIKHARKMKYIHNRYKNFFDYGDAKSYRGNIETLRRDFEDLTKKD